MDRIVEGFRKLLGIAWTIWPMGIKGGWEFHMGKSLSNDLRQRVVEAYERGEGTQPQIAERFGVGEASVRRWVALKRKTGGLEPKVADRYGQAPEIEVANLRVLEAWLPVVLRWCCQLGGRGVDAEAAAGDVLTIALRADVRVRSSPTRLFGITRRVLRRYRLGALLARWLSKIRKIDRAATAGSGARTEGQRIQDALHGLSVADRKILVLAVAEARPDTEVAGMLGVGRDSLPERRRAACSRFLRAAAA